MDEERKTLILKIAEYAVMYEASTRKIGKVFGFSNVTAHNLLTKGLERLCKEEPTKENISIYNEVQEILDNNKAKSIEDENIKNRVLKATKLFISGLTIEEIAQKLDSTFFTIYRDLTVRLHKIENIEKDLLKQVSDNLKANSEENLKLGSYMSVETQKRDKGRFV